MQELLVVYSNEEEGRLVSEVGSLNGFRVKATDEPETALLWLEAREFDAAFIHRSVSSGVGHRLAAALWQRRPEAPLVLYDLSLDGEYALNGNPLAGADFITGEDALPALSSVLQGATSRRELTRREVLIVEDLDASRDIICACVESSRITVCGVGSGREALDLLGAAPHRFSCIVSDVRMPEMDGRELISRIRADLDLKHLPIIVLTAFSSADALVECLSAGATGFLLKPPKIKDLQREIERGFRILERGGDPRLLKGKGVNLLKEALVGKGFV